VFNECFSAILAPRLHTLYQQQRHRHLHSGDLAMVTDDVSLLSGWWSHPMESTRQPKVVRCAGSQSVLAPPCFAAALPTDSRTALRVQRGREASAEFVYAVIDNDHTVYCRLGQFERFPRHALRALHRQHVREFLCALEQHWIDCSDFGNLLFKTLASIRANGLATIERYIARCMCVIYGDVEAETTTVAHLWHRFLYFLGVVDTGLVVDWCAREALKPSCSTFTGRAFDFFYSVSACGGAVLVRNGELLHQSAAGRHLLTRLLSRNRTLLPKVTLCSTSTLDRSLRRLHCCDLIEIDSKPQHRM